MIIQNRQTKYHQVLKDNISDQTIEEVGKPKAYSKELTAEDLIKGHGKGNPNLNIDNSKPYAADHTKKGF